MSSKKRLSSLLDYMKITDDDDDYEYEDDDLFDDDEEEESFSKFKKPSFLSKSKKDRHCGQSLFCGRHWR